MKKGFFIILVIFGFVAAALKVSVSLYMKQKIHVAEPILFEVNQGESLSVIGQRLQENQIIHYSKIFSKLGQHYGYDQRLKLGEYQFTPEDTYQDVLEKIVSGKTFKHRITFVEGNHLYQYARLVEARGLGKAERFIRLARDKNFIRLLLGEEHRNLEGYLFPDTYFFSKKDGEKVIIRAMVQMFLRRIKKLNLKETNLTRHQLVTLASIIEKETGASFERPRISSVFHNRLKKRMRLQTDPTILYGIMDQTGRETLNIRKSDIRARTDYNTYVINGLPPGPIANPGWESLKAALYPAKTQDLYFVSRNDGTHIFSTNYKDHQNAVRVYQMNPKMKEGKSWRDLNKKTPGAP